MACNVISQSMLLGSFVILTILPIHGLPGAYMYDRFSKSDVKCDQINRFGFKEEGKVWYDTCPPCHVCGATELKGALLESQNWCVQNTGGEKICRSDCGCKQGYYRHNITRRNGNIEDLVEICISALECANTISAIKCPSGQIWDQRAPFCLRTCNNTRGLHNDEPCPKLWSPRCICPFNKPILYEGKCITVEDCPK